jgi:hypothetical protein
MVGSLLHPSMTRMANNDSAAAGTGRLSACLLITRVSIAGAYTNTDILLKNCTVFTTTRNTLTLALIEKHVKYPHLNNIYIGASACF